MTIPTPAAAPVQPEPTHGCLRCGRPIPIHTSMCEACNPLGLKEPAATQVHAIAAGGVILFVLFLAVVGRLAIGGNGPFTGTVDGVAATDGGLAVTLTVANAGSGGASTTCLLVPADRPVGGPSQLVQTPKVDGGTSITFTTTVGAFGTSAVALAVDCKSP